MDNTAIKICGLQDVEVLKSMINLPIDYIGFVFAPSRRQVTAEQASLLTNQLKAWQTSAMPQSVGVFVNPDMDQLREVMNRVKLDVIQLHGQESPRFCREIKETFHTRVFKVLSVKPREKDRTEDINYDHYAGMIDGLLLDTFDPHYGGGSGNTFAWDEIPFYRSWTQKQGIPLLVAGGLAPTNVADLVRDYAPDGVDVSSGVETGGTKDIGKIAAFVERVKQA